MEDIQNSRDSHNEVQLLQFNKKGEDMSRIFCRVGRKTTCLFLNSWFLLVFSSVLSNRGSRIGLIYYEFPYSNLYP